MAISMTSNTDKAMKARKWGILRTSIETLKPCFRLQRTFKTFHSPRKSSVPICAVETSPSLSSTRPSPASRRVTFAGDIVEFLPATDLLDNGLSLPQEIFAPLEIFDLDDAANPADEAWDGDDELDSLREQVVKDAEMLESLQMQMQMQSTQPISIQSQAETVTTKISSMKNRVQNTVRSAIVVTKFSNTANRTSGLNKIPSLKHRQIETIRKRQESERLGQSFSISEGNIGGLKACLAERQKGGGSSHELWRSSMERAQQSRRKKRRVSWKNTNELVEVHELSQTCFDNWDDCFYTQDELADFRHANFLEDLGLDESDFDLEESN